MYTIKREYSPYSYFSHLITEQENDIIFNEIRDTCNEYLYSGVNKYDDEYLIECLEFTTEQYDKINQLQQDLEVPDIKDSFVQIGHNLDLLTIYNELKNFDSRTIEYSLSVQLSSLKESLILYTSILNLMLKE